ncbi:MAG: signal peptide peptidase SppA [Planctomycetes bacterium]|nr:signal peptide peptidase SppA [Planctomycetota bacterium]
MRRNYLKVALSAIVPLCLTLVAPSVHAQTAKPAEKATLAVFRINGAVGEAPRDDSFPFGSPVGPSLKDLVTRIRKAADDPTVKAVVMLFDGGAVGQAQTEELRQAMAAVRSAGKEVYVHSDSLSMGDYVLLSGASRLSVVPTADLWITGINGESPYVRGLLDMLGVKPDFLTCGEYKSAAEMFMLKEPSPAADKMQNWLLDGIFDTYVRLIADGRGVQRAKAREWIDNGPYTAEKAMAAGIVDAVEHRQEFTALLKEKFGDHVLFEKQYGKAKPPQLDFSSPFAMFQIWGDLLSQAKKKKATKDAVGIVYVEGGISLGGGAASPFGEVAAMSSDIRKALDEAAADDTIKAVVLRVNSPGGSAVASEIILDATKRVKAKKPFVVSMGDVAGSGGYYVACGSDVIFADEATITGSIGVVGGKLATTEMWKKAGITFKAYQRGKNAGLLSSANVFTVDERAHMQAWMDDIYGVFKGHVTKIRGDRLKKPIDELAGGRVYTGRQALELGLVDKIGTLQDAIAHVAQEAKLKEYDVRVVPRPKNFIELLLEESSGGDADTSRVALPAGFPLAGGRTSLVDLALPYLRNLDPQRVSTVVTALQQLELVQQEGVMLTMPPMRIGK